MDMEKSLEEIQKEYNLSNKIFNSEHKDKLLNPCIKYLINITKANDQLINYLSSKITSKKSRIYIYD